MRSVATLFVPALLVSGCNFPCDSATRLNGEYAVWMHTVTHQPSPPFDAYPSYQVFYNGWSEWSLDYVPAKKAFDLVLDGQHYNADYATGEGDCGTFDLSTSGIYVTNDGSRHRFDWHATLAYFGSHINGVYSYEADWEYPSTSETGSVSVTGEMMSNRIEEGESFDTGF
jgi:hypothetical protein